MAAPDVRTPGGSGRANAEDTKADTEIVADHGGICPETTRLLRSIATGSESRSATGDETKQAKGGRPRKHADAAARQAAYRARNVGVVTWRLGEVADKIAEIAAAVDLPANELAHQMLKFALCNRNWKEEPVFGKLLPNAQRKVKREGSK